MGLLRNVRDLLAFFTVLPVGGGSIEGAAKTFWLYPLVVGAVVGSLAGLAGYGLWLIAPELGGAAAYVVATALTGFHHLDGLLDFGDAIMVRGGQAKRLQVMKDKFVGAGGVGTALLTMLLAFHASSLLGGSSIVATFLFIESFARLTPVTLSYLGTSPEPRGLGHMFSSEIRGHSLRYLASLLSLVPVALLSPLRALALYIASLAVGALLTRISTKLLGGITGDVMGASVEISRCLMLLLTACFRV